MKFSDIYRQLDELHETHTDVVELIERIITDLDRASENLMRLNGIALPIKEANLHVSAREAMWMDCVRRLGAQLNAARTALVRELVDYAQSLDTYKRASKRPLTPVH